MASQPAYVSWEDRLRQLLHRQGPSEATMPFPNDHLAALEVRVNAEAQKRAHSWLRSLWPWLIAAGILNWTPRKQEAFERRTEAAPNMVGLPETLVRIAMTIGAQEADATIPAPSSGAPPRRGAPASREVRKQAEWHARIAAGSKMREWALGMREDVRWQVVQAIREGVGADVLARRLEKRWDHYGQNFARIATTELSTAYNEGFLLAAPERSYVTVPAIGDVRVCADCKRLLEGNVFEVLHNAPARPTKRQLETCLWPGKSNRGREREDWVPCLPLHPSCRHVIQWQSGAPTE